MVLKLDNNGIITDSFSTGSNIFLTSTPPPYGISTFYGESLMSKMRRERSVNYDTFSQDIGWPVIINDAVTTKPEYVYEGSVSSIQIIPFIENIYGKHSKKTTVGILECRNGIIQ